MRAGTMFQMIHSQKRQSGAGKPAPQKICFVLRLRRTGLIDDAGFLIDRLLRFFLLLLVLVQRADRQADTLLFRIKLGDLDLDLLADRKYIGGLIDALI